MNEDEFWECIESVYELSIEEIDLLGFDETQVQLIKDKISGASLDKLLGFQREFSDKMFRLFVPKIGELFHFTVYDVRNTRNDFKYISTDGFMDFRSWIIGMGREIYYQFLNFASEKEILHFDLNPNSAYRDDLCFLAEDIHLEITGKAFELPLHHYYNGDSEKLYAQMNWNTLEEKYPILFAKYQKKKWMLK